MTTDSRVLGDIDQREVTDLYARCAYAYDEARPEAFAALYTEDGAFEVAGAEPVRGAAALADLVRGAAERSPGTRHLVSNVLVRGTGDGASGTAYVVALRVAPPAVRLITIGRYDDEFARTTDGWRIRRRRFTPFVRPGAVQATDCSGG
ncbi:nuclear transport factor 2 family protein [Streptomyces sp. NPDC059255]|uniref:nuclear transport factor 2 family protein n=1 Tax=Streptomyces sp. NPDC059255 TaxID=3346793 RepID=UPI00369428BB